MCTDDLHTYFVLRSILVEVTEGKVPLGRRFLVDVAEYEEDSVVGKQYFPGHSILYLADLSEHLRSIFLLFNRVEEGGEPILDSFLD